MYETADFLSNHKVSPVEEVVRFHGSSRYTSFGLRQQKRSGVCDLLFNYLKTLL